MQQAGDLLRPQNPPLHCRLWMWLHRAIRRKGRQCRADLVWLIRLYPPVCQLVLPPVYQLIRLLSLVYQLQALLYSQKCHRDLLLVYSVALQSQRCTLMALSDGGC
jgi:hypothetical protein